MIGWYGVENLHLWTMAENKPKYFCWIETSIVCGICCYSSFNWTWPLMLQWTELAPKKLM